MYIPLRLRKKYNKLALFKRRDAGWYPFFVG
jgi:hypothetical protein